MIIGKRKTKHLKLYEEDRSSSSFFFTGEKAKEGLDEREEKPYNLL